MTRSGAGNRFRQRKLSTKQSLAVLRENQIDSVDDDAQRNIPPIETGVERQEEIEHHLQAAISASQAAVVGAKVTQIFIPTPNTAEIEARHYESLYPRRFDRPASYIRFSSTVEDCSGVAYCVSTEDEKYLEKLNAITKRPNGAQCKVNDFELIMDHFEKTALQRQPYLSMDVSTIISYEEIETTFDGIISDKLRIFAKHIYQHWKDAKVAREGRAIIPVLKFEQGNEKDDGDPYVCFRRREVRQVRKTRRTDAQSTDKVKKLRQELDTARNLVKDVLQRETMRKTGFAYEASIFEHRRTLIATKRKLGIRGDDEDLIPAKPKKPRPVDSTSSTRIPGRQDGKPAEADLRQLSNFKLDKEKQRAERHLELKNSRVVPKYNIIDLTSDVLFEHETPKLTGPNAAFCAVQTYFLPSPPASADSMDSSPESSPSHQQSQRHISVIQASPKKAPLRNLPTFRRRVGRGGRIRIDRRLPAFEPLPDVEEVVWDRMKYDREEDCYPQVYDVDINNDTNIQFRARMLSPPPETQSYHPHHRRSIMGSSAMPQGNNQGLTINTQQAQMMNVHPGMSSAQLLQQQSPYQQSPQHTQHRIPNGQQYPMMTTQHAHPAPQAMMVNGHGSPGLPPNTNNNQVRR
ncbi:hypothetical protein P167DRAFT_481593 [Morchella conica CCBAS932]|uniref:Enhancer of polycomb-like protein n=1 Tax=Morchella conica CCBAS932 TaxID=1392247 RepID=A0A3N4KZT7_9PEZI|nr:hypothetical protein P167DRAFT_481593 [Morchella conica CCBAS932]